MTGHNADHNAESGYSTVIMLIVKYLCLTKILSIGGQR